MTASGGVSSPGTQAARTRPSPVVAFALAAASLLLLTSLAILWRSLLNRIDTEIAREATLAETMERYRLLQLDEAATRQRLQAAEQDLRNLRGGIPSAAEAMAELARYGLYAAESGVSAGSQLGETTRHASTDPGLPDLLAQRWKIEARGDVGNVLRFLERISSGRFATWRIANVVLKPDDAVGAGEWDVVATADVVVYSYPP